MKEYQVEVNGVTHTFQYSDEDAKRLGLKRTETKAADAPANKARKAAANKSRG